MIWNKAVEDITIEDIYELKETSEKKTLDYKRELKYRQAEEKKEFLADIVSFANTIGGYVIYGVDEENGLPSSVNGTSIMQETDKEELSIQNIIRDNIIPRIQNIGIKMIPLDNGKYIVVLHIPQSLSKPHMIKSPNLFFARHSNGKYPLDIFEVKSAFIHSEGVTQKVRDFRLERVSAILAQETPVSIPSKPQLIMHILPYQSFAVPYSYNVLGQTEDFLKPILAGGYLHRIPNFDGVCFFRGRSEESTTSYVQLFKNGCVESVQTEFFLGVSGDKNGLHTLNLESGCNRALKQYITKLEQLGILPPFSVMLTLTGVKGYLVLPDEREVIPNQVAIRKDILLCDPIFIEDYAVSLKTLLPAYEAIWNAGGYESDLNYDNEGNWRGWKGRKEGFENNS